MKVWQGKKAGGLADGGKNNIKYKVAETHKK